MENRFRKIIPFILLFVLLIACNKFEMRGFVLSYELADERFEQSMVWNSTHPFKEISVAINEYSIFTMADSHVGETNNMDVFMQDAISSNAAATVMVGDLTTGHTEDYNTFVQHIPHPDTITSFSIVGNHDLYFDGWKKFYSLLGSSTYLFTIKTPQASDLYICLDSGSGTLGSKQLAWLKNILETERANYRHCTIFTHNNLARERNTGSTAPLVEELYVLLELCLIHDINAVVTGHDHQKNEVTLGNTTHITMDALLDGYEHAGYLKLNVNSVGINSEFVEL